MQKKDMAILQCLKMAIKHVESKVNRDFIELENLRRNYSASLKFATMTLEFLKKEFIKYFDRIRPDCSLKIKGGEEKIVEGADFTIHINPIAGFKNFVHAIPYFATVLTVTQKDKNGQETVICGVINNYITQEMFFAELNSGAFVNTKRIRVSSVQKLQDAIVAIKYAKDRNNLGEIIIHQLKDATIKINNTSILDLAYTAYGKYDATILDGIKSVDAELGLLLIKEAGGTSTSVGEKIIVGNGKINEAIEKLLNN